MSQLCAELGWQRGCCGIGVHLASARPAQSGTWKLIWPLRPAGPLSTGSFYAWSLTGAGSGVESLFWTVMCWASMCHAWLLWGAPVVLLFDCGGELETWSRTLWLHICLRGFPQASIRARLRAQSKRGELHRNSLQALVQHQRVQPSCIDKAKRLKTFAGRLLLLFPPILSHCSVIRISAYLG